MDETDKMEFERLINNCEMHIFSPELTIEMTEILKEMYMNPKTKEKVQEINSKKLLYALRILLLPILNHESKYQNHILKNVYYQP